MVIDTLKILQDSDMSSTEIIAVNDNYFVLPKIIGLCVLQQMYKATIMLSFKAAQYRVIVL